MDGVRVTVYEPAGSPAPASMPPQPTVLRMTIHRAAMVASFARYLEPGFTLGRLEAQKLIYFLQVAGAPFDRLRFAQGPYRPYADGIRHVLNQVEGHFIQGFGDADAASKICVVDDAVASAEVMLDEEGHEAFRTAVDAVAVFTSGFDDAFGLELLASVHWVGMHGEPPARNATEATRLIHEWSARKRRRYDPVQIRAAWRRLDDAGLVVTTAADRADASPRDRDSSPPMPQGDLIASAL